MESVVSARTNRRPGNSTRAKSQASGTPKIQHMTEVMSEVSIDNHNASRISRRVTMSVNLLHGVRHINPTKGARKKAAATAAINTICHGSLCRWRRERFMELQNRIE